MGGPASVGNLQSATGVFAITPSDANRLNIYTRGIYVAGSATLVDLAVELVDGTEAVFEGIATGVVHPIQARKVLATGTTATGILGLY